MQEKSFAHSVLPHAVYAKLPTDISERWVLLLDPMLGESSASQTVSQPVTRPSHLFSLCSCSAATGGSVIKAIEVLQEHDVPLSRIIFLNLISSPEGLKSVHEHFPEVRIITGWVDEGLNEQRYIIPGLGDFGGYCDPVWYNGRRMSTDHRTTFFSPLPTGDSFFG